MAPAAARGLLVCDLACVASDYVGVQVARSAAVWELKAAIQGVFIALYNDMENAVTWYATYTRDL